MKRPSARGAAHESAREQPEEQASAAPAPPPAAAPAPRRNRSAQACSAAPARPAAARRRSALRPAPQRPVYQPPPPPPPRACAASRPAAVPTPARQAQPQSAADRSASQPTRAASARSSPPPTGRARPPTRRCVSRRSACRVAVPPTLRLRIEDPERAAPAGAPATRPRPPQTSAAASRLRQPAAPAAALLSLRRVRAPRAWTGARWASSRRGSRRCRRVRRWAVRVPCPRRRSACRATPGNVARASELCADRRAAPAERISRAQRPGMTPGQPGQPPVGASRSAGPAVSSGSRASGPGQRPGGSPVWRPSSGRRWRVMQRRGPGGRSGPAVRRCRRSSRPGPPPVTRTVTLAEGMTVKDLADKLDVARQGRAREAARPRA